MIFDILYLIFNCCDGNYPSFAIFREKAVGESFQYAARWLTLSFGGNIGAALR